MAPVCIKAALLVPMKKFGTISFRPNSVILSNHRIGSVMVLGVKLMGASPPVMIVAASNPTSMTAMMMVTTGQKDGRVFITSSLDGDFSLSNFALTLCVIRPKRPLPLCWGERVPGGVAGGVKCVTLALASSWAIGS